MSRDSCRLVLRITVVLAVAALVAVAVPGCERITTVLLTATGIAGTILAYLIEAHNAS